MITLGSHDRDVPDSALADYVTYANRITGTAGWDRLRGEADGEWLDFRRVEPEDIRVAELQGFLRDAGFLPDARIDGICGYRTTAAIRLFQEYVRTIENDASIGSPDGVLGARSTAHVRRWQAAALRSDYAYPRPSAGHEQWMRLLDVVRQKRLARPTAADALVASFRDPSDSAGPAGWDLDPAGIHLVGIRRNAADGPAQRYDDLFILLVRGLAFAFLGSADPGHTSNPRGFPFLLPGQHRYRFGWHKLSDQNRVYHALKPARHGVLVARSKDRILTDADLAAGCERNATINVHWGGEGTSGVVGSWSEGCQVITGKGYLNHRGTPVDCSRFAAASYAQLGSRVDGAYQTKGAYTVLADLAAALATRDDNTVRYVLLDRADLDADPALARLEAAARAALQTIG